MKGKNVMENKLRPKILIVVPTLRMGAGVASHVMNYYDKISDKFDIDFITFTKIKNKYTDNISDKNGSIFYFGGNIFKKYKNIKSFFKENAKKYDIIHCHVLNRGVLYLYFAKKYGIKNRITHVHNAKYSDNTIKYLFNAIAAKICLKLANVYVACSDQSGKKVYHKKPFRVINNGIDLSKFSNGDRIGVRTKFNIDDSAVLFGNVGRLAKQKNQVFTIEIFAELKKTDKFKDSKMMIIGKGPDRTKLIEHVKRANLENDVYFVENTDDIANYYAAMDCFILPSLYEGMPVSLVEAQASGLVCFCTDSLTKEAFSTDLVHGLSLKAGPKSWCDYIVSVNLSRKERSSELGKAGFDMNIEKDKLIEFYQNFCQGEKVC